MVHRFVFVVALLGALYYCPSNAQPSWCTQAKLCTSDVRCDGGRQLTKYTVS